MRLGQLPHTIYRTALVLPWGLHPREYSQLKTLHGHPFPAALSSQPWPFFPWAIISPFLPFLSSGVSWREYSLPTKNEVPVLSGDPHPKTGILRQCDSPMHE
jgi:hypothetical protein